MLVLFLIFQPFAVVLAGGFDLWCWAPVWGWFPRVVWDPNHKLHINTLFLHVVGGEGTGVHPPRLTHRRQDIGDN